MVNFSSSMHLLLIRNDTKKERDVGIHVAKWQKVGKKVEIIGNCSVYNLPTYIFLLWMYYGKGYLPPPPPFLRLLYSVINYPYDVIV